MSTGSRTRYQDTVKFYEGPKATVTVTDTEVRLSGKNGELRWPLDKMLPANRGRISEAFFGHTDVVNVNLMNGNTYHFACRSVQQADEAVNAINSAIDDCTRPKAPSGSDTASAALHALETLNREGLLTESEYAAKRAEILRRL